MKIGPPISRMRPTFGRIPSAPKEPARRKALLVGINYDTPESPRDTGFGELVGPRKDAIDFRRLLIDVYGYLPNDVVVMVDGQGMSELAPTRHNIVLQIEKLVRGARSGDRFVFLYSGHSGQIACLEHSEADGLDEVILPMDHGGLGQKEKLIVDNDLKKLLVEPLPPGAYLTAIFDSCHSGTLLDLEHYECNMPYHPWISKGHREIRKTRWMNLVRKDAAAVADMDINAPGVRILERRASTGPGAQTLTSINELPIHDLATSIGTPSARLKAKRSSLQIFRPRNAAVVRKRASTSAIVDSIPVLRTIRSARRLSDNTSVTHTSSGVKAEQKPATIHAPVPVTAATVSTAGVMAKGSLRMKRLSSALRAGIAAAGLELAIPACMSPVSMLRECDGNCQQSPTEKAHVISLAACGDPQLDWEDSSGASMTQLLIKHLEQNPHPTLGELITFISYRRYDNARALHAEGNKLRKKQKRRRKANGAGVKGAAAQQVDENIPVELVNFQDPQLGSREKLDLNATFTF